MIWKIQEKKTVHRGQEECMWSCGGHHFQCCGWSAIGARSCQHLKAYNFDATNGFRQTISQVYADLWKIYGDAHTCSVVSELEGAVRFAWEREPSFVSLVWVFMEKLKTSLGMWRWNFPSYGRSGERIIILRCLYPWNGSQPKIYLPRISRVHQLMSLDTSLGLLGKCMCILVFYVEIRIFCVTHASLTADFERIQYDKPFQPHTISSKNIEASSSMQGSRSICQAAQIWSINHASPLTIKYQKLRFQVALKKYRWYGGSDIFGWGQSSYSPWSI